MANVATRIGHTGYGQIELNQVAFRRDGRIEAQAKIDPNLSADYVENGMMLALNPVTRTVGYPASKNAEALLNYTTEHMYDERFVGGLKYFKLEKNTFYPRLGYLAKGDKFTTNCVSYMKGSDTETGGTAYADETALDTALAALGTTPMYGHTFTDGSILIDAVSTNAFAQVVCKTTMPDGQKGIKFIAL